MILRIDRRRSSIASASAQCHVAATAMADDGRTAYAALATLREEMRAMREATAPNLSRNLHALAHPTSDALSLYPTSTAATQRPLALERWRATFAALHTSAQALKDVVEAIPTESNATAAAIVHEQSADAVELSRAAEVIRATTALHRGALPSAIPQALYESAYGSGKSVRADRAQALHVLSTLCEVIVPLATELGLESFLDKAEMEDASAMHDGDTVGRVATLTSGGRIIVLDAEVGLAGDEHDSHPNVAVHLSYAHDEHATQATVLPVEADTRLASMLSAFLQQLACALFGCDVDVSVLTSCPVVAYPTDTPLAQATRLWQGFVQALTTLAYMDELCAQCTVESSPTPKKLDLFALLEALGQTAEAVCRAQAASLAQSVGESLADAPLTRYATRLTSLPHDAPKTSELLQRCAQGMAWQHTVSPYLTMQYYTSGTTAYLATIRITPCAVRLERTTAPPLPFITDQLQHAVNTSLHEEGEVTTTYGGTFRRNVAYVAELNRPVLVPHRVASVLRTLCGLPHRAPAVARPASVRTMPIHALATHHAIRAGTDADADEDLCAISTFPFTHLGQMYAVLGLLRDHARFMDLLTNASHNDSAHQATASLGPASDGRTSQLTLRTDRASVVVRPTTTNAAGYVLEVADSSDAARHPPSTTTMAWAEALAQEASIASLLTYVHAWAEGTHAEEGP